MICGEIELLDSYGNISSSKRYKSKEQRNDIIKTWQNSYALKNKIFLFNVIPDEPAPVFSSGYVCIYSGKNYERRLYRSISHRNKIVEDFVSSNKLNEYTLEILPN